jgi:hypothetical protein
MLFGTTSQVSTDVDVDGEAFTVTMDHPNGAEACMWAAADDWSRLFPGSLPDEQRAYWEDRLADPEDRLDRHMLQPVAFRLARQVYGVPWWAAHRITEEAVSAYLMWQAWCVKHGFDPAGESADRIIASIVGFVSSHWDDQAQAQSWQNRIFMRPTGVKDE